jgi:hypothetical protein
VIDAEAVEHEGQNDANLAAQDTRPMSGTIASDASPFRIRIITAHLKERGHEYAR